MSTFIESEKDGNYVRGQNRNNDAGNGGNYGILGFEVEEQRRKIPARRKILSFVLRFAVSLALLLWILKSVNLSAFKEVIISPNLVPIVAMVGFSLVFVFLGGLKLWILFRGFSPIGLWLFTAYFFLAGSVGSLMPAIFSDFTLIGLARRSKIPFHESVSALLMDRLITMMISLLIFTPLTLAFVLPVSPLYIFMLTMVSVVLFGGLIWITLRFASPLFDKFLITKRFWGSFSLFLTTYRINFYKNIFISSLRGIVSGIALIFALMAANLNPPFFPTICISNSLSIITYIPVSLGGLGIYEGGGLILLESLGLNREQVAAGLFYQRFYIILWSLVTISIWGIVIVIKRFKKRKEALPGSSFSLKKTWID